MTRPLKFSTILLAVYLSACGGGTDSEREALVGPCSHTYQDPVFTITSVTSSVDAKRIADLTLTGIMLNGVQINTTQPLPKPLNVAVQGSTILCTVPCGFAVAEGTYSFVAVSPGYKPAQVQIAAKYSTFVGGCPSYNSGSTEVSFKLEPA